MPNSIIEVLEPVVREFADSCQETQFQTYAMDAAYPVSTHAMIFWDNVNAVLEDTQAVISPEKKELNRRHLSEILETTPDITKPYKTLEFVTNYIAQWNPSVPPESLETIYRDEADAWYSGNYEQVKTPSASYSRKVLI